MPASWDCACAGTGVGVACLACSQSCACTTPLAQCRRHPRQMPDQPNSLDRPSARPLQHRTAESKRGRHPC
eukprot:scaffold15885_cov127-Isochrysis_galbana.AAC.5